MAILLTGAAGFIGMAVADRLMARGRAVGGIDELMSDTYAHLFRIPMTGLRFFTVYGTGGRPDMAMWIFTS